MVTAKDASYFGRSRRIRTVYDTLSKICLYAEELNRSFCSRSPKQKNVYPKSLGYWKDYNRIIKISLKRYEMAI